MSFFFSRAACISLNDDGDSFLFGTKLKNVEEVKLPVLQKQWCLKSSLLFFLVKVNRFAVKAVLNLF